MSEERLNDDLAAIEAALRSLTPAASGIDRDRLMFLAGRASANRRSTPHRWAATLWPMATAASLFAATTFGILWATGNSPKLAERATDVSIVGSSTPLDLPADPSSPSPWENRRLCQLVLEKGIDALPESSPHRVSGIRPIPCEENCRSLLKQFLENPNG